MEQSNIGMLVVITGAPASGKDTVKDLVIAHPEFASLEIKNIITCTDRPRRINASPPEPPDAYHFVSPEELDQMEMRGLLAEPIIKTGKSRKATPISEIERLLKGESLLWRIEPSRASDIAAGSYFKKIFPENANILQENTIVICINAPREVIEKRRRKRDGDLYDPENYLQRDMAEAEHLDILLKRSVVVNNPDGGELEAAETVLYHIKKHYEKVKAKK